MNTKELEAFIKNAVDSLRESDDTTTFYKQIDDIFAVYVGWDDGFEPNDETVIHSKSKPNYCICVKVAEYNPYCPLWDNVYMPWYCGSDEVYDTEYSISSDTSDENYHAIAEIMLRYHEDMHRLFTEGVITFGE